jgi:hypothetical protein
MFDTILALASAAASTKEHEKPYQQLLQRSRRSHTKYFRRINRFRANCRGAIAIFRSERGAAICGSSKRALEEVLRQTSP